MSEEEVVEDVEVSHKKPRELDIEEEETPVLEAAAPKKQFPPCMSIEEASRLLSWTGNTNELGTAWLPDINWAADAVFKNHRLLRQIAKDFPPIVHMSLKRAFPREYKKAFPDMNIFEWVWKQISNEVDVFVPWRNEHEFGDEEGYQKASQAFSVGFDPEMKYAVPHISGGVLLEILQGDVYTSTSQRGRDLDIFCTLTSQERQKQTGCWYLDFL